MQILLYAPSYRKSYGRGGVEYFWSGAARLKKKVGNPDLETKRGGAPEPLMLTELLKMSPISK